jgi:MarR family transcriptional regulator, organic hydroperoxide resistance regulator
MPDEALVARAIQLSRAIARGVHGGHDDVWRRCELTLPQLRCLFLLSGQGPMPIGGVARELGIGLPSASSLVDRLVDQGLVQRREDPMDRRRTLASTTASGSALADQLRQGSVQTLRGWLGALRREDLRALVQGLAAVVEAAELTVAEETVTEETGATTSLET